jgi:hypothetical protein
MRVDYLKYPGISWLKNNRVNKGKFDIKYATQNFYEASQKIKLSDYLLKQLIYDLSKRTVDGEVRINIGGLFGGKPLIILCAEEYFIIETINGIYANGLCYDTLNVFWNKAGSDHSGSNRTFTENAHADYLHYRDEPNNKYSTSMQIPSLDNELLNKALKILAFIRYADIEVRVLNNTNKTTVIKGDKIENNLNTKVDVLDATWYTTLIRTEGFKVSGHFRLQPYGEGMKDKKLIWISDFEKKGYTRTAKKLNTNG